MTYLQIRYRAILVALLAIFSLQNNLSAQTKPAPVGLELYSLRAQFAKDVPGTMKKVKAMGFREVEVAGTYGLSVAEFRKLLDANGIKAISTGSDFKRLQENPQAVADEAKALGARYVVCAWVPHNGDDFTIEDAKKAVDVFNKAGKVLKENGLQFCYHAHGYEFRPYEQGTLFDYMVANMNPEYANFEMDIFWVKHPGQDPVALLKKYPNRFPLSHLKDRKPGTPGNQNGEADVETNVVLGAGDVGVAAFMKAAPQYGVKYHFIEDEASRAEERLPKSVAFLRKVMK